MCVARDFVGHMVVVTLIRSLFWGCHAMLPPKEKPFNKGVGVKVA